MNYQVDATYDRASGLASETYPSVPGASDRRTVSYTPDAAARVASLSSSATSYAPAASVSGIGYAANSALQTETYGNSLIHAVTYNNRLQPSEIKLGTSGAPTSVVDLTYNFGTTNNNGNLLSVGYAGGGLSNTQTFGYDALNRLTTSVESGSSWSQTNVYDRYGLQQRLREKMNSTLRFRRRVLRRGVPFVTEALVFKNANGWSGPKTVGGECSG